MDEIVAVVKNPAFVSAAAAVVSAIFAGLAFMFSRKPSRRDVVDTLKIEILRLVYTTDGRNSWVDVVHNSEVYEDYFGPNPESLVVLLPHEYRGEEWISLILPALEELKREGYRDFLGLTYPITEEDYLKSKERASRIQHK